MFGKKKKKNHGNEEKIFKFVLLCFYCFVRDIRKFDALIILLSPLDKGNCGSLLNFRFLIILEESEREFQIRIYEPANDSIHLLCEDFELEFHFLFLYVVCKKKLHCSRTNNKRQTFLASFSFQLSGLFSDSRLIL